jgi:3-oxoacyl-[acyl-carrier protein] reductase
MKSAVAVVTGATGGIGSAVCRRLAAAGASVVVGFRRDESLARSLAASLADSSTANHCAVQVDVTDSSNLGRFAEEIGARYGKVDLLVNSVGTTRFVPHADLEALDDELIDEIFRTNWRGAFATIRALRPLLEKADSALVVNISSVAGVIGIGSNVAYCASKAALNAMTVSLARALAPAIRVVSVSPGVVETDFIKGLDESWRREQLGRTPLGRLASPDDVADAVLAVATTLRYSTGCIIPVDGGRPLA